MPASRVCADCATPLTIVRIPRLEGHDEEWTFTLLDYPVLACPYGHERREANAEFNVVWSEDLGFKAPIWARRRGFVRGRAHCPQCDVELQEPASGSREVPVCAETELRFRVNIAGPWSRCAKCDQLFLRERQDFYSAAADALERGGIKRY